MLKSSHSVRALTVVSVFMALLATLPSAKAQDFTMQVSRQFSPSSVEPGGTAGATIAVSPLNGFNGSVSLAQCDVTPVQTTSPPTCTVSPQTVTPPASPSLTLTTLSNTPPGSYVATVTGVGGATTQQVSLNFAVLTVTPGYTITVTGSVTPSSVHAGSGATAILTVTPANGYTGSVTLSCSAITPTATPAPSCSFDPTPVVISGPTLQTSTLTITTTGTQASISHPGIPWAIFLPFPAFALIAAGLGSGGNLRRRFLSLTGLCAIATALFVLPACNSYGNGSTPSNGTVTPNNTYTFTLDASDANAMAPSNGTQTVSLTVN
jgi:hypothetical protein